MRVPPPPTRRRSSASHRLLPAALALLCLGLALEIHPPGEAAGAGPWGGDAHWTSCHPGLAVHMEAPAGSEAPTCPACLLRLTTAGAHLPADSSSAVSLAPREAVADLGCSTLSRSGFAPFSRGPPLA